MIRRPPRSTRTDTLFPYTTLFRSHRFADTLEPASLGVAEGRIGEKGDARFVPHAPCDLRRAFGDVGEHLRRRPLVDRRVGHEDRVMLVDEDVDTERRLALGKIGRASCRERVCQYV